MRPARCCWAAGDVALGARKAGGTAGLHDGRVLVCRVRARSALPTAVCALDMPSTRMTCCRVA